jgi:hypothetical protein
MDYREESFKRKFSSAAQHLNVGADQIVSLKFRENVGSYDDYRELIDMLQSEAEIHYSEVDGDLQGRGYMLGHGKTKLLLVEHETGLEILYIAGSIASLLGLIPLVLQGWAAIRGRLPRHGASLDYPVEIRQIDQTGRLNEKHLHPHQLSASLMPMGSFFSAIATAGNPSLRDRRFSGSIPGRWHSKRTFALVGYPPRSQKRDLGHPPRVMGLPPLPTWSPC